MIDIIFEGIYFTKIMFIISEKYEEISKEIGILVKRGSTGIYSKGMYSGKQYVMLFCVAFCVNCAWRPVINLNFPAGTFT